MHYYKRNLGDYAKKAGRLSMLQHGAYTLLIDSCYDREQFPTLCEAIEWTWASTEEEVEAVKFVLSKFFTLDGDVYVQTRIQEELSEFHEKSCTNKRIAIERETKRKSGSTNSVRVVNEPPPNHKPLTINHKPVKLLSEASDDFDRFWTAYPKKTGKKAALSAWRKAKPKIEAVLKALEWQKNSRQWLEGFIPNPQTYLNQGRWDDEPEVVSDSPRGVPARPWYISATAIEEKAKELGITQGRDEQFLVFRNRIYEKAGITPEMVRKATIDFQPPPQGVKR